MSNIKENCELLEKARELAKEKGLDVSSVTCSLLGMCDGRKCGLIVRDQVKRKKIVRKP